MNSSGKQVDDSEIPFEIALDLGENQKDPAEFRDLVILADKLNFDTAWLGDHFMPWTHSGNRSSFVWSLIASALESSRTIQVGPYVTTPIGARYHPLIIAQASATLDNMYPGRFVLGVGTGEAVNEAPFLERWPNWNERMERMIEGIELMRNAWTNESYFDHNGRFFKTKQVYLYTKPKTKNLEIQFSAVGPKSASFAGRYGDGIITLSSRNSLQRLRDVIIPRFEEGAKEVGKDPALMKKIVSLSFTFDSRAQYLQKRRKSAGNLAKGALDEPDPRKIQNMGLDLSDEQITSAVNFCSGWSEVLELISKIRDIGFTQVVLESGPNPELIKSISQKILPNFHNRHSP